MSAFAKWLVNNSKKQDHSLETSTPAYVLPGGEVARFVFQQDDIYAGGARLGCPKPKAFKPDFHPDLKRYELSVCGLNSVSEDRILDLGRTIREREKKIAFAAITLLDTKVTSVGLFTEPAPELPQFPEHGVILGWSQHQEAKSERLQAQQDLAVQCSSSDVKRLPAKA